MYSLSGDTAIQHFVGPFTLMEHINSILLQRDTLIYAGKSYQGLFQLKKFNIKNNILLPWVLPSAQASEEVELLEFSQDSSLLIYTSRPGSDPTLRCIYNNTGVEKYKMRISLYAPSGPSGFFFGLKVVNGKGYIAGEFETVATDFGNIHRKGFLGFDINTGTPLPVNLELNNPAYFLDVIKDKIYLSGKFSMVNGTARNQFVVLDTVNLAPTPWQLNPSDPLTAIAYSNNNVLVSGYFTGINATPRNGLAAIDSATRAILPFHVTDSITKYTKRMFVKGDTLITLLVTSRFTTEYEIFESQLKIYSISTGSELGIPNMNYLRMDDCLVDSNFLYVSVDKQYRRYHLPTLTRDFTWGHNFGPTPQAHNPMYMIFKNDKLYSVGDSRFINWGSSFGPKRGWLVIADKSTGQPINTWSYEGEAPDYDVISFDKALVDGDRIFIQGFFKNLNGKPRKNFVAVKLTNGAVTDWRTDFTPVLTDFSNFTHSSELKLYNGKIWFGALDHIMENGRYFHGLGALDTVTGNLMPAVVDLRHIPNGFVNFYHAINISSKVNDFIFDGNSFMMGGLITINYQNAFKGLFRSSYQSSIAPTQTGVTIIGPSTIYIPSDFNLFYVQGGNSSLYTYTWSYAGTGVEIRYNGGDSVWLKVNPGATSGNLIVYASNYCGSAPSIQKAITVSAPVLPPVPTVLNVSNKCRHEPTTRGKLANPHPGATIVITQDGSPVTYQSSDSSFLYFTSGVTTVGNHNINVKYTNIVGTSQKDTAYSVTATVTPSVSISGTTTVNAGSSTLLTSAPTNGGSTPAYQWYDSTNLHNWQIIAGATTATHNYTPALTGDKVRCTLTSNAVCANPVVVTSNAISFIVNVITALPSVPGNNYGIRLYPNPGTSTIILDSLKLSDKWETLSIYNSEGQKIVTTQIRNQTQIVYKVETFPNGAYLLVLRRKSGLPAFFHFIKM